MTSKTKAQYKKKKRYFAKIERLIDHKNCESIERTLPLSTLEPSAQCKFPQLTQSLMKYELPLAEPTRSLILQGCALEIPVRQDTQLIRVQDNRLVDALLVTLAERHLNDFAQLWKPELRASTEEDKFWDWEMKNRVYLGQPTYEGYAIECDNRTQGLMLIETRIHRSWYDSNRRIVYIHSLATAPWNRPTLNNPGLYRATGGTLLEFAQTRSEALGYGGLVGLHALEGAEDFYRRMRMSECGPDEEKENLIYFEWYRPQDTALEWWDTIDEE